MGHIRAHLAAFALALVWDCLGVWGTRSFAEQSLTALPLSAVLMLFWVTGVSICRDRRLWPALILGAVTGTWLGITFP